MRDRARRGATERKCARIEIEGEALGEYVAGAVAAHPQHGPPAALVRDRSEALKLGGKLACKRLVGERLRDG
jgi:hypothetical protein